MSNKHQPMGEQRRRSLVATCVDRALDRALESLDQHVWRGDLTADEVTAALADWPDFQEAWENHLAEEDETE